MNVLTKPRLIIVPLSLTRTMTLVMCLHENVIEIVRIPIPMAWWNFLDVWWSEGRWYSFGNCDGLRHRWSELQLLGRGFLGAGRKRYTDYGHNLPDKIPQTLIPPGIRCESLPSNLLTSTKVEDKLQVDLKHGCSVVRMNIRQNDIRETSGNPWRTPTQG